MPTAASTVLPAAPPTTDARGHASATTVHAAAIGATREELSRAADMFGQLDLGDPRMAALEPEVDRLVLEGLALTDDPRRQVWHAAVTDPEAPLVVKLRVLAAVVQAITAKPH